MAPRGLLPQQLQGAGRRLARGCPVLHILRKLLRQAFFPCSLPPRPAQRVPPHVVRNAEQPSLYRRAAPVAGQRAQRLVKGFGQQLFGLVLIAAQAQKVAVHRAPVKQIQLFQILHRAAPFLPFSCI